MTASRRQKGFRARARTYPARSIERESLDRDAERITQYLQSELRPSANGLAIFACAGADDFFEAVQLGPRPHFYPLARLTEQYRPIEGDTPIPTELPHEQQEQRQS